MSQLAKAQQAIGAGDFKSARSLLNHHLQHRPEDPDGLYLLGICEQAGNQPDAARLLYECVLAHAPEHFGANYNMGLLLSGAGQDLEALPYHDAAVRLQPGQFWARINRGNARARLGQHEAALEDYRQALQIQPHHPQALSNMGNALRELGRLEESLQAHDQAVQTQGDQPEAWAGKAATLIALRRPEEALAAIETSLQLNRTSAQAWITRGSVLRAMKRWPEALASYDEAVQLQPTLADAWHNRGIALGDMGRQQEALDAYDQALRIDPRHAQAWFYRGTTLALIKSHQEALQSFEQALQLAPRLDRLRGAYLLAKMTQCDWRGLDGHLSALKEDIHAGRPVGTPLGLTSLLDDPADLAKVAAAMTRFLHPPQSQLGPLPDRPRSLRIRIAYYSADFRTHPVAQLIVELLEQHDRSRFELIGFSFGPDTSDPLRQRVARAFDRFIDVREQSDAQVARLSRELGIDIAVNLGGYTDGARTDIFAMRAAPVQVSYLGYPGTMSAPYIDYLISDAVVCPPGSQAHYTEKVVCLPHCFMPYDTTQEIASTPVSRQEFGLPESGFVFCCFNNHLKITPAVFDVWMRLLAQVAGSVLWLSDGNPTVKENLRREAQARGLDPARIVFARRIESMAEHLARYRLADLFVDTLPYNAHTTASDALWAGVPVLTCAGATFASRVAASMLQASGLPDLVTHSLVEYEALALDLASDPVRLDSFRLKLAESRPTAPLFDVRRLAKDIEQAFTIMLERHQAGLAPAPIQNGQIN